LGSTRSRGWQQHPSTRSREKKMTRTVVKLGGDIVKGEIPQEFLADLKKLLQTNQVILVHGGGDVVTEIATKLGKEQRFVVSPEGMKSRYTDRATVDIFTMVMCGMIAKKLVEFLERSGISAVSLSGLDGGVLRATRKKKLLIVDERGRKVAIEGGYTGKMRSAGGPVLEALLERGIVPIISPVAMGEDAEPLNVDSDMAAAFVAMGVHADAVLFLTDVKGFLMDGKVVERLTAEEARAVLPKTGFGMQKKILAGIEAVDAGVGEAIIASGFGASPLSGALAHDGCTVLSRGR
jgi:acetylglutamate/LysW-gamma-L-alpha-aminoadipate kinase